MSGSNQTPFAGLTAAGVVQIKSVNMVSLVAGTPQGLIEGQSGSAQVPPDLVWDYVGHSLWICTQGGSDPTTTVWTQIQFVTAGTFTNLTVSEGLTAGSANIVGLTTTGSLIVQGALTLEGANHLTGTLQVDGLSTLDGGLSVPVSVPTDFFNEPVFHAGLIVGNGVPLAIDDNNGIARTVLVADGAGDITITPLSTTGNIRFNGVGVGAGVMWTISNPLGRLTSRTGTGTFKMNIDINPEGNGVTVTQAAGSATNVAAFESNIAAAGTSTFHASFLVNGAQAGGITSATGTTVTYGTTSDRRIKTVFGPFQSAGAIIDQVPVWQGLIDGSNEQRSFFIADELQRLVPWAVIGERDAVAPLTGKPIYQLVDHPALVSILWAELQHLRRILQEQGIRV